MWLSWCCDCGAEHMPLRELPHTEETLLQVFTIVGNYRLQIIQPLFVPQSHHKILKKKRHHHTRNSPMHTGSVRGTDPLPSPQKLMWEQQLFLPERKKVFLASSYALFSERFLFHFCLRTHK